MIRETKAGPLSDWKVEPREGDFSDKNMLPLRQFSDLGKSCSAPQKMCPLGESGFYLRVGGA